MKLNYLARWVSIFLSIFNQALISNQWQFIPRTKWKSCELRPVSFFFLTVGLRSLWQAELPDETPAGARLQGAGRGAAARHSPLVAWRAPRPARLTPAPAGQEVERGQWRGPGKQSLEVDVGMGDNQYPMHLSISYRKVERAPNSVPLWHVRLFQATQSRGGGHSWQQLHSIQ